MNGQLNGFHEAFIEEGTFLFTSESVGEGHPGEPTGTQTGKGGGQRRLGWERSRPAPAAGTVAAFPRVAASLQCVSPFPSPFLRSSSGGAPRHAEGSRNLEGRGLEAV